MIKYHFIILLFLVGCAKKNEEEKLVFIEKSLGKAFELRHTKKCEQNFNFNHSLDIKYHRAEKNYVLKSYKSNNSMYEDILTGGVYAYHYDPNRDNHLIKFENNKIPNKFIPCSNSEFSKDTYEYATFHVISILDKVQEVVRPKLQSLEKINLSIAPIIKHVYVKKKDNLVLRYSLDEINNAGYSKKNKEIIFLPQGIDNDGHVPYNNIPLWDVPMVTAHEYGHHVFNQILTNKSKLISDQKLCFDNYEKEGAYQPSSDHIRAVGTEEVITAINEAFADLFARYTIGSELFNLESLGCFENSRDMEKSHFLNGDLKRLDFHAKYEFFNMKVNNSKLNCNVDVNYQDPHIIGAIIAHVYDTIYNKFGMNDDQKLDAILNWVKNINSLELEESPKLALEQLVLAGFEHFEKEKRLKICEILIEKAPAILSINFCDSDS